MIQTFKSLWLVKRYYNCFKPSTLGAPSSVLRLCKSTALGVLVETHSLMGCNAADSHRRCTNTIEDYLSYLGQILIQVSIP